MDVLVWGLRLRLRTRGNVSEARLLFMPRFWEPREREILRVRARPGFVFVDAGANVGGYACWVHSLLQGDCTILAVEPDPDLQERLAFNVAANRTNIRLRRMALGVEAGTLLLRVDPRNRGENRVVQAPLPDGARYVAVPVITLLALAVEEGLPRIDALKIDVEGMELPVLGAFFRDAPPHLWPRLILMEHHDTPEHRTLEGSLRHLGYRPCLRTRLNLAMER